MKAIVLEKLQWPRLLDLLASFTQTHAGKGHCLALKPSLSRQDIEDQWRETTPLRDLIRSGYVPPIGDLPELTGTFRATGLGQVLDGEALREILSLLQTVQGVQRFASDFASRCLPLQLKLTIEGRNGIRNSICTCHFLRHKFHQHQYKLIPMEVISLP